MLGFIPNTAKIRKYMNELCALHFLASFISVVRDFLPCEILFFWCFIPLGNSHIRTKYEIKQLYKTLTFKCIEC